MKLLPSNEIQQRNNSEEFLRITRIKDLRDEESRLRIQLTNTELEYQRMLLKNRTDWEKEWEEHQKEVQDRKSEIEKLEAAKLAASVPFEILKTSAEEKVNAANEFLSSVKKRESEAEELKEILEGKISEVSEREDAVLEREQKVIFQEQHAKSRIEEANTAQKNLALAVDKFNKDSAEKRAELQSRESSVVLKEKSLISREESLVARENDLKSQMRRIRDEQDVLARAWNEIKAKK